MKLGTAGKRALVTGSTAGIGVTVNALLPNPTTTAVMDLTFYLCGAGASGTTGAALRVAGGVVNQIM